VPVYVWTAPGLDVKGGLSHILLRTVPGCFHPAQEALVSDRASVLLAADVAVAGARGKARSSPGCPDILRFPPGAVHAEPQARGLTYGARETAVAQ